MKKLPTGTWTPTVLLAILLMTAAVGCSSLDRLGTAATSTVSGEDTPADEDVPLAGDAAAGDTDNIVYDTSVATPPPAGAAPAPALTIDDFTSVSVPSLCDHPAGTLRNGALDVKSDDGSDPGYLELADVEPGQLDDDPDYEYVVTFGCSQGGVSWPSAVVLFDSDQSVLADFSMADMYVVGPWRGGVGFTWSSDYELFFGDVFYEVSAAEAYESWSVIESSSCTVAFDPEESKLVTFNPLGGQGGCRHGTDGVYYQQAASDAGVGATVNLAEGNGAEDSGAEDGGANGGEDDWSESDGDAPVATPDQNSTSGGDLQPSAPNPDAISCDSAGEVFRKYLLAAGDRDYSSAWAFLAQSDKDDYGSFSRFADFWDTVSLVGIEEQRSLSASGNVASNEYIMFYDISSGRQYERVEVDTSCDRGVSKIVDYRFIEIVDY